MSEHIYRPGSHNLITDVSGLKVGNATDQTIKTGVTVLVGDKPFMASVMVMGGAPGTRETDLLEPERIVEEIDAIFLSGGSAFGLDAGSGIANALARQGRGFRVGPANVPIVPGAILFDLLNGGEKAWEANPYAELGARALDAAGYDFELGSVGCGTGAGTAGLKGGLGSASLILPDGIIVGALVGANPTGQVVAGPQGRFWAAPWEMDGEYGGLGAHTEPVPFAQTALTKRDVAGRRTNTTIAIVATNARLTSPEAKRMAVAAHDGIARAVTPAHTPVDGDLVFSVATGEVNLTDPIAQGGLIGHAAAQCLSRAIARAVYSATPQPGDMQPCWSAVYGDAR